MGYSKANVRQDYLIDLIASIRAISLGNSIIIIKAISVFNIIASISDISDFELRSEITTLVSNVKVHSLTARSLTKEFREMSQLNLPRTQRNRMDIYSQNHSNSLNESESSNASTACSPTNEGLVH